MRILPLVTLGLAAASGVWAQKAAALAAVPHSTTVYNGAPVRVSMYIWSDRYDYQPGQNLTLRWTVKTNNDLYPYTVFVYRQNNQTGAKTYYPSISSSPVDIDGNSQSTGFQPQVLTDKTKAVLLGAGGIASAVSMPN